MSRNLNCLVFHLQMLRNSLPILKSLNYHFALQSFDFRGCADCKVCNFITYKYGTCLKLLLNWVIMLMQTDKYFTWMLAKVKLRQKFNISKGWDACWDTDPPSPQPKHPPTNPLTNCLERQKYFPEDVTNLTRILTSRRSGSTSDYSVFRLPFYY